MTEAFKPGYLREEITDGESQEMIWVCNKRLEIGIVLDVSVSIPSKDFATLKKSLSSFLKRFNIGPKAMRISLIPFENEIHAEKGFKLTNNKAEVLRLVEEMPHIGLDLYRPGRVSFTNTGDAIEYMRSEQLSEAEVRQGIPRVAVVFTDGNSQKWRETEEQARLARNAGIKVYAVGFGRSINLRELERISGDRARVTRERDIDNLENVLIGLSSEVCEQTPKDKDPDYIPNDDGDIVVCNKRLELGIVLDVSVSINQADFETLKTSLLAFLERFNIGSKAIRISLIPFENNIHPTKGFSLTHSKDDVLQLIKGLPHIGVEEHQDGRDSLTNTGDAIQYMRSEQLSEAEVRTGIPRVAVVFTDGNSQNWKLTEEQAALARSEGIKMYAVGFGQNINLEELERISGDNERVKLEKDFGQLEQVLIGLSTEVCEAADKVKKEELDVYFVFSKVDLGNASTQLAINFIEKLVAICKPSELFKWGIVSGVCPDDAGFNLVDDIESRLAFYRQHHLTATVNSMLRSSAACCTDNKVGGTCDVAVLIVNKHGLQNLQKNVDSLRHLGAKEVIVWNLTGSRLDVQGCSVVDGQHVQTAVEFCAEILAEMTGQADQ